jgi:hypothetical protein
MILHYLSDKNVNLECILNNIFSLSLLQVSAFHILLYSPAFYRHQMVRLNRRLAAVV